MPPPPPRAHIVPQIVLEKMLSVKKIAFLLQTVKKQDFKFSYSKKSIFLAPHGLCFKAFASLRLQKRPFVARKILFFSYEKSKSCSLPVLYKKNTIAFVNIFFCQTWLHKMIKAIFLNNYLGKPHGIKNLHISNLPRRWKSMAKLYIFLALPSNS